MRNCVCLCVCFVCVCGWIVECMVYRLYVVGGVFDYVCVILCVKSCVYVMAVAGVCV